MRKILIAILLLISIPSISQSFKKKLEHEICNCFEQKQDSFNQTNNLDVLDECFDTPFEKLKYEIEAEIAKKIDSTATNSYELGMEYGRQLFNEMQDGLIFECDSYYEIMQGIGKIMYKNLSNGVTTEKIDSLSKMVDEFPKDEKILWERGVLKLGNDEILEAQQDFIQCLEINPDNNIAKFCLGWTYDLQDDHSNAFRYYNEAINSNQNIGSFREIGRINLSILKRKMSEK